MKTTEFQTLDERITAYLTDLNGRALFNSEIARHFGMLPTQSITVLKRLERGGVIRPDRSRSQTKYFVPTEAQKAELQATLDAAMKTAAEVRRFKPYTVPKAMLDVMARVRAERESVRSYFGEAA